MKGFRRDVIIGQYQLIEELGSGGFGLAWKARDTRSGDFVALKQLNDTSPQAMRRFTREAEALKSLHHQNCVGFIELIADWDRPILVMEFADGQTLTDWIERAPHPHSVVADVAYQITAGLHAAHLAGVLHRDLKPDNVVVTSGLRGAPHPKIVDFGLAKLADRQQPDVTKTGEVLGTPGFMSPEQLRGVEPSPASDAYTLGVLFFVMWERRPLFEGSSALEIAMKHLLDAPPPLSQNIDGDVRDLVALLLSKEPERRPPLTRVMHVLAVAAGRRPPAPTAGPPNARQPARRRPWVALAAAAVFLAVVVGVVVADRDEPAKLTPRTPAALKPSQASTPQVATAAAAPATPTDVGAPVLHQGYRDAAARNAERAAGCGAMPDVPVPDTRNFTFEKWLGWRGDTTAIRLPANYDPNTEYPVIILLTDMQQGTRHAIHALDGHVPSALSKFVVIVPDDPIRGGIRMIRGDRTIAWKNPETAVRQAIEHVSQRFCIELDKLYLVGHGVGAGAAERLVCDLDRVAAIATTAYTPIDDPCTPSRPVPRLHIAPLRDLRTPLQGGLNCLGETVWSQKAYADFLVRQHKCSEQEPTNVRGCDRLTCETPLTLCTVEGGWPWPGSEFPERLRKAHPECDSQPGKFPYAETIWRFFLEHHNKTD